MADYNPKLTPEELQAEIWKPVVGFEDSYEVSSHGRVRNTSKHILAPSMAPNGYLRLVLMKDGKRFTHSVHGLVATAFIGSRPTGKQVNHKSGIKTENHFENLEYCTPLENKEHARRMGLTPFGNRNGSVTCPDSRPRGDKSPSRLKPDRLARGENHGNTTLSNADVTLIRARLSNGEHGAFLAREFKVGKSTISRIKNNRDRFSQFDLNH